MVDKKINDMFEQRQNTGKRASLAEKYANAVGQLSDANDRAAHAEHDLQVERITRQDLIDEEVARRVAEAEERIRLKVEAEFAEQKKALENQKQELEAREKEITKKADTIVQNIEVSVNKRLAELRSRAEDTALTRLADMFETFLQAFIAVVDNDSSKGQELLAKYRQKAEETQTLLKEEIKEKLDKAEAKSKAKTDHVVSLVRMLFTPKSERIVFTPEQRENLYERAMQSLNLTEESKKEFERCRDYVQPVVRPIVRRKDNPTGPTEQADCHEGLFWKSYATPELVAKIEAGKYVLHLPFNRQIKKMKQDGLPMAPATMDDWHQATCDMIEPLYELQKGRVFSSPLLAGDGSPFPIINCEKHKTVGHYMIQYRSVTTGIPIFLVNTKNKCGRGKADIMDNLKDWTGNVFMCDAYAGYDWMKKIDSLILCRCVAHGRRMSERALKENPPLAQIALLFYQESYLVEEMIKEKGLTGVEKAKFRREHAGPIWETFKLWAASAILDVPKDSLIFKALNYLIRNYDEFTHYLDIPEMPIDNTDTERLIRDMVMGKKSYLFCRDLDACKRAAMMYSLFGACKVLDKNPERWLCHVLKNIKTTPNDKLYTLLPEFWEDEEQQK